MKSHLSKDKPLLKVKHIGSKSIEFWIETDKFKGKYGSHSLFCNE